MSTSPRQRWLLAIAGSIAGLGVAFLVRRLLTDSGVPQAAPVALPLRCRVLGHGWTAPKAGQLPVRHTCRRCESLDLPLS